MPYITKDRREAFDDLLAQLGPKIKNKGEFNYCISILAKWYISVHGTSYQTLSDARAAMLDAAEEWARRNMAPYEDEKIKENGDLEFPAREKIEFQVLDEDNGYPD